MRRRPSVDTIEVWAGQRSKKHLIPTGSRPIGCAKRSHPETRNTRMKESQESEHQDFEFRKTENWNPPKPEKTNILEIEILKEKTKQNQTIQNWKTRKPENRKLESQRSRKSNNSKKTKTSKRKVSCQHPKVSSLGSKVSSQRF